MGELHWTHTEPMICTDGNAQMLATLPPPTTCGPSSRQYEGAPSAMRIQLYKTNTVEQSTTAHICTITVRIDYITRSFFGHITRHHERRSVVTNATDCIQMVQQRKCNSGRLYPIGDVNATQNLPTWTTPERWFGCCVEQIIPTYNCYVRTGTIYKVFNASTPRSTFGDVQHCSFHQGANTCQLHDGSIAQYTINGPLACVYEKWLTLDGLATSDGFVSQDRTYAFLLSSQKANPPYNCENELMALSADGMPYHVIRPEPMDDKTSTTPKSMVKTAAPSAIKTTASVSITTRRSVRRSLNNNNKDHQGVARKTHHKRDDQTVTTDWVTSQVDSMKSRFVRMTQDMFDFTWHTVCQSLAMHRELLTAYTISNPTLAVRAILHNGYLRAQSAGTIIEIQPCFPIRTYQFLPLTTDECSEWPKLSYSVGDITHIGYLDVTTNIIRSQPAATNCHQTKIPVQLLDIAYEYDTSTGNLMQLSSSATLPLLTTASDFPSSLLHGSVYDALAIYNFTNMLGEYDFNALAAHARNEHFILSHLQGLTHPNTSEQAAELSGGILTYILSAEGPVTWSKIVLWIVVIWVLLAIVIVHCMPCIKLDSSLIRWPLLIWRIIVSIYPWEECWRAQLDRLARYRDQQPKRRRRTRRQSKSSDDEEFEVDNTSHPRARDVARAPLKEITPTPRSVFASRHNITETTPVIHQVHTRSPEELQRSRAGEWADYSVLQDGPSWAKTKISKVAAVQNLMQVSGDHCLTTNAQIAGKSIELCLIDPGSGITIIREDVFKDVSTNEMRTPEAMGWTLDSTYMSFLGCAELAISLGTTTRTVTVHIKKKLPYPLVIGRDYTRQLKRGIHLNHYFGYYSINGSPRMPLIEDPPHQIIEQTILPEAPPEPVPTNEVPDKSPTTDDNVHQELETNVVAGLQSEPIAEYCDPFADITINAIAARRLPPDTETVLPCVYSENHFSTAPVMFEPFSEYASMGLIMPRALINANERRPRISVINFSDDDVWIEKGQALGGIASVYDVDLSTRASQKTPLVNKPTVNALGMTSSPPSGSRNNDTLIEWPTYLDKIDINPDMTPTERGNLQEAILENQDVFVQDEFDQGRTHSVEHYIPLIPGAQPIRQRPYRIVPAMRDAVTKEIDRFLNLDYIEATTSPWGAPILPVLKKNGEVRIVVDYRRLNDMTIKDSFPLPRIDDLFQALSAGKIFSTLDFSSSYHQIPMAKEHRERTAFVTHQGAYQWKVMPMGLTSAPATFQRLVTKIFSTLVFKRIVCFIDDLCCFADTHEEHIAVLKSVWSIMRNNGLTLQPSKCSLHYTTVSFLGHIISGNGLSPDPKKIDALTEFPTPTNVAGVRSFLGLAGYYRDFVQNYATMAEPLHRLLRKREPWKWEKEEEEAFTNMKNSIAKDAILHHPDLSKTFHLFCDGSTIAIGAILKQEDDKGVMRPICFKSRALTKTQSHYPPTHIEALACVHGLKMFRHYLAYGPFTLYTDHRALEHLFKTNDPDGRIVRWSLLVQRFLPYISISYKPGPQMADVDALSRNPIPGQDPELMEPLYEFSVFGLKRAEVTPERLKEQTEPLHITMEEFKTAQVTDPIIGKLIAYKKGTLTDPQEIERVRTQHQQFILYDDALYYAPRTRSLGHGLRSVRKRRAQLVLAVPRSLVKGVLRCFHDDILFGGHMGYKKTIEKIAQRFWFFHMAKIVTDYVRRCIVCQLKAMPNPTPRAELTPLNIAKHPYHTISVDLLTKLPETTEGHTVILMITDMYTRYAEAYACRTASTEEFAEIFIQQVICRHGCVRQILSDRGGSFLSRLVTEINRIFGIRQLLTTAFHPQTNGLCEAQNKTCLRLLSRMVGNDHSSWHKALQPAMLAYNISLQHTMQETPFFLIFHRDPILPLEVMLDNAPANRLNLEDEPDLVTRTKMDIRDALENAQLALREGQEAQKAQFDTKATDSQPFKTGDLCLKKVNFVPFGRYRKFIDRYVGPYRIEEADHPIYRLARRDTDAPMSQWVNWENLKPYVAPWTPGLIGVNDETDNVVDEPPQGVAPLLKRLIPQPDELGPAAVVHPPDNLEKPPPQQELPAVLPIPKVSQPALHPTNKGDIEEPSDIIINIAEPDQLDDDYEVKNDDKPEEKPAPPRHNYNLRKVIKPAVLYQAGDDK